MHPIAAIAATGSHAQGFSLFLTVKPKTGTSVLTRFAVARVQHVGAEMRAVRPEERPEEPVARPKNPNDQSDCVEMEDSPQ